MIDPRKGCLLAKRPVRWQQAKRQQAAQPAPAQPADAPQRTYQYTPRGDLDSFVKFFSSDTGEHSRDPD